MEKGIFEKPRFSRLVSPQASLCEAALGAEACQQFTGAPGGRGSMVANGRASTRITQQTRYEIFGLGFGAHKGLGLRVYGLG